MSLAIKFIKQPDKKSDTLILPVFEGKVSFSDKDLDQKTKTFLKNVLEKQKKFKGKLGQSLDIYLPDHASFDRAIIYGLGKASDLTSLKAEEAGGKLFAALQKAEAVHASFLMEKDLPAKSLKQEELCALLAHGLKLRSYKYDEHVTAKKDTESQTLKKFDLVFEHSANANAAFKALSHISDGVILARNFVNDPPNTLYPDAFAKRIRDELKPLGVSVEILDEKKMQKLGMGAILAVGMGSEKKPRMVIMEWKGVKTSTTKSKSKDKVLGLVGKGVTFDTGGISLKPGAGMHEMKMDMGGAAAVVGTMKTLALRKAKAHVVAIVGLAENMPSSMAYRPGDIVKSYAGKTIEVLNTDAEGRLVLADCMTHIQKKFSPDMLIDLATLTGAMMVALGHEYCGTFVNDNSFWKDLEKASHESGENLWRMPLDEIWKKEMEGSYSDLQNLAKSGRYAGACTAAGFLEHFVEKGVKWAHMDVAGVAWRKSDKPTVPKYGTGFGVRILNQLVVNAFEKK
jgi:leucyl aminopeptidase